jgi:hypothetical protein
MPKYKIPAEKSFDEEEKIEEKVERFPTISFPASEAQVSALDVGSEVEVTFKGTIESATLSKSKRSYERTEIRMEIKESDIYSVSADGDTTGVEEMSRDEPADILT